MATDAELFGDFQSQALSEILRRYYERLPPRDLPSDAILDTMIVFLRTLFGSLGPEHKIRWIGNHETLVEDEANTGISIETETQVDPERLNHRPSILVTLGDRRFMGVFHGQEVHQNVHHNTSTFQDLQDGVLVLTALSRHDHVARRLAEWAGMNCLYFRKALTFGGFHAIKPNLALSKVRPAGELVRLGSDHTYVAASAIVPFTWTVKARLRPSTGSALLLKGFRFEVTAYGLAHLDGSGAAGAIVDDSTPVKHLLFEESLDG